MSDKERKLLNTLKDVACGHYSPEEGTELILSDFAVECRAPAPQPDIGRLAVDLCRELYDRFMMGGWLPAEAYDETVAMLRKSLADTPQVTPRFPDCNVGTAHECCVARMKRLEKEQYGQIWEGTSEQAPQVTPTLKEILKQYGAHHIRDCDALNKWKELPCNCGFAALIEGTPEASSAKCRSPYHRPTAMFCLDCIPPNAPLSVLLLSNRQPTEEETKRGLDIAKAKGTK